MSPMLCVMFLLNQTSTTHEVIHLWPNGAPGSESRRNEPEQHPQPWSTTNIYNPSITVYLPPKDKATGAAMVIAPGGGHSQLVVGAEGTQPAEYFSARGIACFVLKYRLAREKGSGLTIDKDTRADGNRAMRLVRSHAAEWGIDPHKVGMLGFSAGGEVLSMSAFGPTAGDPNATDPIDRLDARPDFGMWVYPGPLGIPKELPKEAPPAFLLVSNDDDHAPFVMDLTQKYRDAKLSVETHILSGGGHGFNMGDRSKLLAVKTWPLRLVEWLTDLGYLRKAP